MCDRICENPALPAFLQNFQAGVSHNYRDMNDSRYSTSTKLQLKESHATGLRFCDSALVPLAAPFGEFSADRKLHELSSVSSLWYG